MKLPLLAAVGLAVAACGRAQDAAQLDHAVQAYVDKGWFMGSVLVARGDQILLSKGYGSANLEWGIPNDPATKFRIGSLTKQFTAAAILLLQERGKLRIDDPVKKFLPDAPAAWDKITIFHLLTHTSGIPSFTGFPDYDARKLVASTPEQLVAVFRDKPLEFAPGEKWNYDNSGYLLLGYLIEKISGETYASFVQKNIFAPLDMKDSGYDSAAVIPHRASGYEPGPDGPRNASYVDMTVPFAAGALYSTTEDLWRWEQALFSGKLLTAESLRKMTTPFKNEYAFGLGIGEYKGQRVVAHSGGIEGFSTFMACFPEEHLTVVALGNLAGPAPEAIVHALSAMLHGETPQLPVKRQAITLPEATLRKYAGTYDLGPQFAVAITVENGKLIAHATNQPKFVLLPESETKFFLEAADIQVEFVTDAGGAPTALVLHQGGQAHTAPRK